MVDRFNLQRFVEAQNPEYDHVKQELPGGRKNTYWMWYIFPQIRGLGISSTSNFYALSSTDEASAYLMHPALGARLRECCKVLLNLEGLTAREIFGSLDEQKLCASMTLFMRATDDNAIFNAVMDKYFAGSRHRQTLELIGN